MDLVLYIVLGTRIESGSINVNLRDHDRFILESAILLRCVPNITLVPRLSPLVQRIDIKERSHIIHWINAL